MEDSGLGFLSPQCAATSVGAANSLMITLVATLLSNYCNTSSSDMWPDDYADRAVLNAFDTYDFVVIGAGTAGSVVASRLAENPSQKVLLIEAGGNPPLESEIPSLTPNLFDTEYDWSYTTKGNGMSCLGSVDDTCRWPKGKVLGGSSSINAMLYTRGSSRDYDDWEDMGNAMWNWGIVKKYFNVAEKIRGKDEWNIYGKDGPQAVEPFHVPRKDQPLILKAAREIGYKKTNGIVDGDEIGFGYYFGTLQNGRRMSTAKAYLKVKADNLHIIKNSVAKRINFNANKKAESVTFVIRGANEVTVDARKEVILSAGSIESPKLLMLSGIGPKSHLEALGISVVQDLPVGNNLQDHPAAVMLLRMENQTDLNSNLIFDATYDQWIHRVGPLGMFTLNVGAFINTAENARWNSSVPDVQFVYMPITNLLQFVARFKLPIRQSILHQIHPEDRLYAVFVSVLRPQSRGTVRLASTNYLDKPVIAPDILAHEDDMATMMRGIRKQLEFEGTKKFMKHRMTFLKLDIPACSSQMYRSNGYWRCYARHMTTTLNNAVGTTRMGHFVDPETVVDSHLRVKGVKGLRVIDASIMPKIVGANTNAATMMIGEKGADYVKSMWSMRRMLPEEIK